MHFLKIGDVILGIRAVNAIHKNTSVVPLHATAFVRREKVERTLACMYRYSLSPHPRSPFNFLGKFWMTNMF